MIAMAYPNMAKLFLSYSPNGRPCPIPNASIRIEESKYRHMSISPWKIAAVPFAGIALRPANELSRQLGERREAPGWYAAAALYLCEFLDTCKRYATLADDARPAATQPARPKGERTTFHPLLSAFITLPPPLGPFAAGRLSETTFGARALACLPGSRGERARRRFMSEGSTHTTALALRL